MARTVASMKAERAATRSMSSTSANGRKSSSASSNPKKKWRKNNYEMPMPKQVLKPGDSINVWINDEKKRGIFEKYITSGAKKEWRIEYHIQGETQTRSVAQHLMQIRAEEDVTEYPKFHRQVRIVGTDLLGKVVDSSNPLEIEVKWYDGRPKSKHYFKELQVVKVEEEPHPGPPRWAKWI